ncbi:MAG: hypothetical protein Q9163_002058 [Psora crenata]
MQVVRSVTRTPLRPYRTQWRAYADLGPPNPTTSNRGTDNRPVSDPIGVGTSKPVLPMTDEKLGSSSSSLSDTGKPDKQPLVTRYLQKLEYIQDEYSRRNLMHTKAVEEAAHDRNLFEGSPGSRHIELKFPEIFDTGSQRNISAGSQANLDELKAYYHRKYDEAEAARMERLKKATDSAKILGYEDVEVEREKRSGLGSILEAWGLIGKPGPRKA